MSTVCVNGEEFEVVAGELCLQPGLSDLREIVSYTTAGVHSFTKAVYPWLTRVLVRVVGAGGGGGGCEVTAADEASAGGGGAGGGYAEALIEAADLSDVEQIVVGGGGTGTVGFGQSGEAGGPSWFGSQAVASGGGGGRAGRASDDSGVRSGFAQGGGGTTGDVRGMGGDGESSWGRGSLNLRKSGYSGGTPFGFGRKGRGSSGPGSSGRISCGEGGSGGANGQSQATPRAGGDGADGRVVVYLYG